VEADHADDLVAVDDRQLEAVVVGELPLCRANELELRLAAVLGRPRQPLGEVRAVRLDEAVERLGVPLLERAQVDPVGQVEARLDRPSLALRPGTKVLRNHDVRLLGETK
jgi:hypothetical protein